MAKLISNKICSLEFLELFLVLVFSLKGLLLFPILQALYYQFQQGRAHQVAQVTVYVIQPPLPVRVGLDGRAPIARLLRYRVILTS